MQLVINNYLITTPILDIIKQLKQELKAQGLNYFKEIHPKGEYIRITCPFHKDGQEDNPSCSIYSSYDNDEVEPGFCHCFTCNTALSLYKMIAYLFDKDEEWGKQWIIDRFGNTLVEKQLDLESIELEKEQPTYLDESILDTFEDYHPYMTERKLNKEVIEKFKVKYDPKDDSLVFPVWDEKDNLVMLTKRSVKNKFFNIEGGKEKPTYLLNYIRKENITTVIITEGQIDALTAWAYGMPAIATIGSPSKAQLDTLNQSGIRIYITIFDNDSAGERFKQQFLNRIRKDVLVLDCKLPEGKKDINDLSKEEFDKCIKELLK